MALEEFVAIISPSHCIQLKICPLSCQAALVWTRPPALTQNRLLVSGHRVGRFVLPKEQPKRTQTIIAER